MTPPALQTQLFTTQTAEVGLGAGRARIVRQLFTESLILAGAGGGLGLLLAFGGVAALRRIESLNLPRIAETTVDPAVLLYSCLITIGAGLLFGIAPALAQSGRGPGFELKQSGERSVAGSGRATLFRGVLVAAELGVATILLVGAGLMMRSVIRLLSVDPGFQPEGTITMQLTLPDSRYGTQEKTTTFAQSLVEQVRAIPGVNAASVTNKLPLRGGWNSTVIVEGKPYSDNYMEGPLVENSYILPGYFKAMGIPLHAGRAFTEHDVMPGSTPVIVNETFVRVLLGGGNPIGRRISRQRRPPRWLDIVGVVADSRQQGLATAALPEMYQPFVTAQMTLVARTTLEPSGLVKPIRRKLATLDKDIPMDEVRTMRNVLDLAAAGHRTYMRVIAIFAAVALALAAVGTYGLVSFAVSQRKHEIGIRMALGATGSDVLRMALLGVSKLLIAGLIIGIAGALVLTQFLSSLLYGITRFDPATLIAVPAFLAAVAFTASMVPALRAATTDPATALRQE